MLWLGVPLWQSILGFHGYSGIPGMFCSNAMASGTPSHNLTIEHPWNARVSMESQDILP